MSFQLWFARTDAMPFNEIWDKYACCLLPHERDKVLSYKFDKDRVLSLVSKVMLRTMLSSLLPGEAFQSWRFATNQYGKPFIENNNEVTPLYFNLSHTEGLVACITSTSGDVGVDVEALHSRDTVLQIAPTIFTPNELTALDAFSDRQDRLQYFFRLWTLKEAYIKYIGKGLFMPLRDFEFALRDGEIKFQIHNGEPQPCLADFFSTMLQSQHMLSVAVQPNSTGCVIDTRDFSDLEHAREFDIKFDHLSCAETRS